MKRIHVLAASLIIGLSAIFGVAAATNTVGLGQSKPAASKVSDQTIAARQRQLNRAQAALRKARGQKPPTLPAVPATRTAPPAAPRVQLIAQPAPVSTAGSRASSDDGLEEDEGDND